MITTTETTTQISPTLLRSAIDERITKIRPSSTPLDQISRLAGARRCGSMKVSYYAVDLKKATSRLRSKVIGTEIERNQTVNIQTDDSALLSPSDTIVLPGLKNENGDFLSAYVIEASGRNATVLFTNLFISDDDESTMLPDLPAGQLVVRMGRAAGELDVQTTQYSAIPVKKENLCQIFKSQIEESLLQRLADKEVGWTFSDQEEAAVLDMRMCMERSFLFGTKSTVTLEDGKNIMLTGGIWGQAGKSFNYTGDKLDGETVIRLMRTAFSESNGSTRKVLLAGSGLIEKLHALDYTRVLGPNQRVTKWGIDFDQIVSKFGTLYIVRSEVFDLCGMEGYGMIIDPEYITKYSHIPFTAERISFRKQGVRNTEGIVLTEASCLVLRYPDAHVRIIPT